MGGQRGNICKTKFDRCDTGGPSMEIEGCVQLCGPCTANTPESTP